MSGFQLTFYGIGLILIMTLVVNGFINRRRFVASLKVPWFKKLIFHTCFFCLFFLGGIIGWQGILWYRFGTDTVAKEQVSQYFVKSGWLWLFFGLYIGVALIVTFFRNRKQIKLIQP